MRISALPEDVGYEAYRVNHEAGFHHRVFVDGIEYTQVITVDNVLGYALVHQGHIGDTQAFTVVHGNVKIERIEGIVE